MTVEIEPTSGIPAWSEATAARFDEDHEPGMVPPSCAGICIAGSGAHRTHRGTECERPAVWWHPDDCWAYCDEHVAIWDVYTYRRAWIRTLAGRSSTDDDCSHGVHGPWCREWERMVGALRSQRAEIASLWDMRHNHDPDPEIRRHLAAFELAEAWLEMRQERATDTQRINDAERAYEAAVEQSRAGR